MSDSNTPKCGIKLLYNVSYSNSNLRSRHLSLPRPFTADLKLIAFTNRSFSG